MKGLLKFNIPENSDRIVHRKALYTWLNKRSEKMIFVVGHTGWGKTIAFADWARLLDASVFWINLCKADNTKETLETKLKKAIEAGKNRKQHFIFLDNYHFIKDSETQRMLAKTVLKTPQNIRFVILSRKELSGAMRTMHIRRQVVLVTSSLLRFNLEESREYFYEAGFNLPLEEVTELRAIGDGCPLAYNAIIVEIEANEGQPKARGDYTEGPQIAFEYIQELIFDAVPEDLQRFILLISLYPEFTTEMAEVLSGREDAQAVIDYFFESGSFIVRRGKHYGITDFVMMFLEYARQKNLPWEVIREAYGRIGHWFEAQGKKDTAMDAYFKGRCYPEGERLLKEALRTHPGSERFYHLEGFIKEVPEADIERIPAFCSGLAISHALNYQLEESNRWYDVLLGMRQTLTEAEKVQEDLEQHILHCSIAMPHKNDDRRLARIILEGSKTPGALKMLLQEVTMTGSQPRLLCGSKDFSNWSRHAKLMQRVMTGPVEKIFGKRAIGVPECGVAEVYYQYNQLERCLIEAVKGKMKSEKKGTMDLQLVGVALEAKVLRARGQIAEARTLLASLEDKLEESAYLLPSYRALCIYMALTDGQTAEVERWLAGEIPQENKGFRVLDRYQYLIKARVYLGLNYLREALSLIELLESYAIDYSRPFNELEALLLKAICYQKMGVRDLAVQEMQKALKKAESYGFIRVIADEGNGSLEILKEMTPETADISPAFFKKVLEATAAFVSKYPAYMVNAQGRSFLKLTRTEERVLDLIGQGMTNVEIAEAMAVSIATVKTHINHIFGKLGVKNRTQAIIKAKSLNLKLGDQEG